MGEDGVAIVVPCFNAQETLAVTIESALGQEGVKEIVVIDDGSTDSSLAIAHQFKPRVLVLTGPNRGVSAARNRGISATSAEWLLFLDSDDLLLPGTIKQRLDCAARTGADIVICDWQEISDVTAASSSTTMPICSINWTAIAVDAERATATDAWATTSAILYRRRLVDRIDGFRADLPVIQDARYLFDAVRLGGRLAHCEHVGAQYRVSDSSLSRRSKVSFWEDVLLNGRQIEALWREEGTFDLPRRRAVHGIYNTAARGLFASAHCKYFEAIAAMQALGLPEPMHGRFAAPLARAVGLQAARRALSVFIRP